MEASSYTVAVDQLLAGVGSRVVYEGSACDSYPCWNEGTCVPSNSSRSEYSCECGPYFSGQHCQIRLIDQCLQRGCQPGMTCSINGVNIHCPLEMLQEFLATCASTPCQNGGTCTERGSGWRCACTSSFHGPFCQYDADATSSAWSVLEVSLIILLTTMILFTVFLICCGENIGFYISVPTKRYSRWEEADISDEDEDQEIALGELKELATLSQPRNNTCSQQIRQSKTSETIVDETEQGQTPAPSCSKYGVMTL